jgi:protein TonB
MFEQSLLGIAAKGTRRKAWTLLASAGFQCLLVGILIVLPLLHIEALPKVLHWVRIEPPPGPQLPEPPPPLTDHAGQSEVLGNTVVAPPNIPDRVNLIEDPEPLPSPSGSVGSVPVSTVEGGTGTTWAVRNLLPGVIPPPPPPTKPEPPRLVSQGVMNARAISQPSPIYPPLARQARIQGRVQLEAFISKIGTIESLRLVSGHPLLAQAALDAVKQWRYRPTLLNGEPVEVLTTIEVNFTLIQ